MYILLMKCKTKLSCKGNNKPVQLIEIFLMIAEALVPDMGHDYLVPLFLFNPPLCKAGAWTLFFNKERTFSF